MDNGIAPPFKIGLGNSQNDNVVIGNACPPVHEGFVEDGFFHIVCGRHRILNQWESLRETGSGFVEFKSALSGRRAGLVAKGLVAGIPVQVKFVFCNDLPVVP